MEILNSEDNRKIYNERKNQVLDLLNEAAEYYKNNDNEKVQVFEKLSEDLKNGEFNIVVVGEFSSGKSTLLNALMRKRILPSFTSETTATVNFLRHSDKAVEGEKGKVFYNNGTQKVIEDANIETVQEYVSTKGNDVAKEVDHLDLYLDSDFLKDGVTLVDSPGLNGIADGHREITEAQILKSHASIFVFNSDHPGSKTDFEFLHELQSKVKTIIFVLNKIDVIKNGEDEPLEEIIQTLKDSYKKQFPEADSVPEIWPVAAYPALVARNDEPLEYYGKVDRSEDEKQKLEEDSRLGDFENRLISFLTCGEKAKQQLLAPVERVEALTKESKESYEEEKKILEDTVDTSEIENQMSAIKEAITDLEKQISESRSEVSSKIKESLRDSREELEAEMSRLQERKMAEIDDFDNLDELVEYLNKFEKLFVSKVYSIARNQEESLRDKILSVIQLQYSSQAQLIEEKMNDTDEIDIKVSQHLEAGERMFKVGLKDMDEKIKLLEEELGNLQNEADVAEQNYYNERNKERKITELKNDIKSLQDKKEIIESQMLPVIETRVETMYEKEYRGGILGVVGTILFGGKNVAHEKMVTDSRAYDEAKKNQENRQSKMAEEIRMTQKELKNIGEADSQRAEMAHIQKMAEVEATRSKLDNMIKENTEKIDAKYKKEVRKVKRELREYCDLISEELNSQVKKNLRGCEKNYTSIILEIVESSLREKLNEKITRLEQLEEQLKSSEEDRNKRISELETKIEKINELMGKASDLQINLSSIEIDEIKQEAI